MENQLIFKGLQAETLGPNWFSDYSDPPPWWILEEILWTSKNPTNLKNVNINKGWYVKKTVYNQIYHDVRTAYDSEK